MTCNQLALLAETYAGVHRYCIVKPEEVQRLHIMSRLELQGWVVHTDGWTISPEGRRFVNSLIQRPGFSITIGQMLSLLYVYRDPEPPIMSEYEWWHERGYILKSDPVDLGKVDVAGIAKLIGQPVDWVVSQIKGTHNGGVYKLTGRGRSLVEWWLAAPMLRDS